MQELDGIALLLGKVKFDNKELGLISEDGVQKGGTPPEYIEVHAAQVRGVVKKVLKRMGTIVWKCRLIELKVQNLIDVVGGSADATNPAKWNAPPLSVTKEGPLEITAVTGQVITAEKVSLTTDPDPIPSGDAPAGVDIEFTLLYDGKNPPYSFDNTALEEG